jgi:hypothetical protein
MSEAAFIGHNLIYRYLLDFAFKQRQWETAFFTINKHWAPLIFHGRTPIVLVVSYLRFYCLVQCDVGQGVYGKNEGKYRI